MNMKNVECYCHNEDGKQQETEKIGGNWSVCEEQCCQNTEKRASLKWVTCTFYHTADLNWHNVNSIKNYGAGTLNQ